VTNGPMVLARGSRGSSRRGCGSSAAGQGKRKEDGAQAIQHAISFPLLCPIADAPPIIRLEKYNGSFSRGMSEQREVVADEALTLGARGWRAVSRS
jgi:hypothetical protein